MSQTTALHTMVDLWKPQDLLLLLSSWNQLRTQKIFSGGFKPEPGTLRKTPVRNRIVLMLKQETELLELFLNHSNAPWKGWPELVFALDEIWLLCSWRDILRTPQGLLFAAGMAADMREKIHNRAMAALTCLNYPWTDKHLEPDFLKCDIGKIFELFGQDKTQQPGSGTEPPLAQQNAAKAAAPQDHPVEKQQVKALAKARKKNQELEETLAKLKQTQHDEQKKWRGEIAIKNTELNRLNAEFKNAVEQKLADYRRQLFGTDGSIETRDGSAPDRILHQAEEILNRQAAADLNSGTVTELFREREKLGTILEQINACNRDSLVVLPEIQQLQAAAEQRLEQIKTTLQRRNHDSNQEPTDPLAERLELLTESASPDENGLQILEELAGLLASAVVKNLLPESARNRLIQQIHARQTRNAGIIREQQLAKIKIPEAKTDSAPREAREIWEIGLMLRRAATLPTLLIDGYNCLISDHAEDLQKTVDGLAVARGRLLTQCENIQDRFKEVIIVYDGDGALTTFENHNRITIVFTAHRDDGQNADNWIIDKLENHTTAASIIWLVTDDSGLRQRARQLCDSFIPTHDFNRFLA